MNCRAALAALVAASLLAGCSGGQSVQSLEAGDCFDDTTESLSGARVSEVPDVDCDEPHDNEVFYVGEYPGSSYDAAAFETFSDGLCYAAFEPYIGANYFESILEVSWFVPSVESWVDGDRDVVCVAYRGDLQKLRGSVRDTGI